ncbi:MAG: sensor histidine kinase [Chitinophagaceae bacterium]
MKALFITTIVFLFGLQTMGQKQADAPVEMEIRDVELTNTALMTATVQQGEKKTYTFYFINKVWLGIEADGNTFTSDSTVAFFGTKPYRINIIHYYEHIPAIYVEKKSGVANVLSKTISYTPDEKYIAPDLLEYTYTATNNYQQAQWQSLAKHEQNAYRLAVNELKETNDIYVWLRLKSNKNIVQVIILRKEKPFPFIAYEIHDSSGKADFSKQLVERNRIQQHIDTFYQKYDAAAHLPQGEKQLFHKSALLLFFRKPHPNYEDSTLHVAIYANDKLISSFVTKHYLLLNNLNSNTHYHIKAWYAIAPDNVVNYRFFIPPYWWQQTWVHWLTALSLITLAALIEINVLRRRKIKAEQKSQQTQANLNAIRSQLNPHFIFNAMNSIQALIQQQKTDAANTYLTRFATLLRSTLQPKYQGFIALQEEVDLLEQYIQLEQLRMPFEYHITINPKIDTYAVELPGMLLQPLVENAIKHGLPFANVPILQINIDTQESDIIISIINNGKCFEQGKEGTGLTLVRNKLAVLMQIQPHVLSTLHIEPLESGTKATIILKNWLA